MAVPSFSVLLLLLVAFTCVYAWGDGIDSSYDYVVVGGGTAGSVLAKKFSDAGYSVLVLERGKRIPSSDLNARLLGLCTNNWIPPFTRDNLFQKDSLGNRQNVLVGDVEGGGGLVNGGIAHLGARAFWNSFGQPKWTFDANIAPSFNRLKLRLSLLTAPLIPDVSLKFASSGASISFLNYNLNDPAGNPTSGFGNISLVNRPSPTLGFERDSTLFSYLDQAPDVDVELDATVTKILFDDKKKARKVEFVQDGECNKVRAKRGVVLAAGTFGSAEILLRSGVGPSADLQALGIESVSNLPVGKNLRDHQVVTAVYVNNCPVPPAQQAQLAFSPGTQVAGFVKSDPSRPYPDIQYTFVPFIPGPIPLMAVVIFLVDADTRGNITLASADPLKPSLKYYEYPGTGTDNARIQWAIGAAESFMATPPFNACLGPRVSPAVGADLTSFVSTTSAPGYHITGTNSMGLVVDQDLKVLGTRNLFVADASVLPNIANGNTNIPAAIVAERGADLIINAVWP